MTDTCEHPACDQKLNGNQAYCDTHTDDLNHRATQRHHEWWEDESA